MFFNIQFAVHKPTEKAAKHAAQLRAQADFNAKKALYEAKNRVLLSQEKALETSADAEQKALDELESVKEAMVEVGGDFYWWLF